ncbi:MAG: branched-chain amino acid ABC transporter permease [Betaproteobacteria bacterium]|jgi:branched-chain amino acid transport system permease protein
MAPEFFFVQLLNGLSYGLLLFMLAAGLTLIFSMMGVLNFAHTSFYMLGAYFAYQISRWVGFWPALVLAPLAVGLLGMLVQRYGLRRVHKWGHVPELLFTFGLSFMIVELVQVIWGRAAVPYQVPAALDGPVGWLQATMGITFPAYRAFAMVVAVFMLGTLWLVLTRTRIGLVIRAALSHPHQVEALGHNVPRVFMLVFGGGCALAGLAGVVGGNLFVTEPGMAGAVGAIVFVIIVIGGMGSLAGAFIASLLLGLIDAFGKTSDWSLARGAQALGIGVDAATPAAGLLKLTVAQVTPVLPFLLLVLVLIFRPKGLLGTRED